MSSTKRKDKITIYWAPSGVPKNNYQQLLLDLKPSRLMHEIIASKAKAPIVFEKREYALSNLEGGLHFCSAFHELMSNTYVIRSPFDVELRLDENGLIDKTRDYSGWFMERSPSLEGMKSVDMDMYYLFFAEESVNVAITAPYMHQTSQPSWGFVTPVKFDVGKWFRPYGLIFHLWPGVNTLTLKKGEPIAYLHFETDRPVKFQQFLMTEEIYKQAEACGNNKIIMPFQSLDKLYDRFFRTGMRTKVLEAIKSSLIVSDVDGEGNQDV